MILLESISLVFLVNGLQRLYMASQGSKYDALINENWEKFESLTSQTAGQFFANRTYWTIGFILIGTLTISFINWKYTIRVINSIILFLIISGISMTGFFLQGITNRYLNYFCGLFGGKYGFSFLVGGFILTLIGILILWKTINDYKSTIHNKA